MNFDHSHWNAMSPLTLLELAFCYDIRFVSYSLYHVYYAYDVCDK